MGYGDFGSLLNDADRGIREARRDLKKLYNYLRQGKVEEALFLTKMIDQELLDGLSSTTTKDEVTVDGTTTYPSWSERNKV